MCAGEYPDPEKDLKQRVLVAEGYLAGRGKVYLVPTLEILTRRSRSEARREKGVVFKFTTPSGERIFVPVGSTVKCVADAKQ